ncbi:hypothetical protein [Aliarcobacter cryaerophilus]|uniref:hypothetical protein n=1 Tax=Aliarcobacter cryaerophilus TaxID=28198 RepID=UPI0008337B51|nr:hypothetical protein [Aliarcobacter cryaerophilus]
MSEELRELLLKLKNAIESQNSEDNDIGQILQDIINQVDIDSLKSFAESLNIDIDSCGENKNCLISLIIKYFMELNNLNFDFIENNEISEFER